MTRNITHFGETGRPNSIIGAVPLTRTAQKKQNFFLRCLQLLMKQTLILYNQQHRLFIVGTIEHPEVIGH